MRINRDIIVSQAEKWGDIAMLDGRQQLAMLKPSVSTVDEEKAHSEAAGVLVGARVENYGAMYHGEEVFNDGDQVVARCRSGFLATALKSV